jgi:hypothetical protein
MNGDMSESGGKLGSREHEYLRFLHMWEEVDRGKTTMSELDDEQLFIGDPHWQVGTSCWTDEYSGSTTHVNFIPASSKHTRTLSCRDFKSP